MTIVPIIKRRGGDEPIWRHLAGRHRNAIDNHDAASPAACRCRDMTIVGDSPRIRHAYRAEIDLLLLFIADNCKNRRRGIDAPRQALRALPIAEACITLASTYRRRIGVVTAQRRKSYHAWREGCWHACASCRIEDMR